MAKISRYKFTIPPASAKRLEKDRRLVVQMSSIFDIKYDEHPLQEGQTEIMIEVNDKWREDFQHCDVDGYSFSYYVEYRNSTGTRKERVQLTPQEVADE